MHPVSKKDGVVIPLGLVLDRSLSGRFSSCDGYNVFMERSKCTALHVKVDQNVIEDWFLAFRPHIGKLRTLDALMGRTSYPLLVKHFGDTPEPKLIRPDPTTATADRRTPLSRTYLKHVPHH